MTSREELKESIRSLAGLVKDGLDGEKDEGYWRDVGAKILDIIDNVVGHSLVVNSLIPKVYSKENPSILDLMFPVLNKMKSANNLFECEPWSKKCHEDGKNPNFSFYELAYSRFCSFMCQLLGDRFSYVQKLLIKNIFGQSHICSCFASDIYMFIVRIIHPHRKMGMVQLIMNICRLAPPEAFVKGAALINRIKHPIVNFEHVNYQYLLELS